MAELRQPLRRRGGIAQGCFVGQQICCGGGVLWNPGIAVRLQRLQVPAARSSPSRRLRGWGRPWLDGWPPCRRPLHPGAFRRTRQRCPMAQRRPGLTLPRLTGLIPVSSTEKSSALMKISAIAGMVDGPMAEAGCSWSRTAVRAMSGRHLGATSQRSSWLQYGADDASGGVEPGGDGLRWITPSVAIAEAVQSPVPIGGQIDFVARVARQAEESFKACGPKGHRVELRRVAGVDQPPGKQVRRASSGKQRS